MWRKGCDYFTPTKGFGRLPRLQTAGWNRGGGSNYDGLADDLPF
jgi:hypothetical protein